MPLSDVLHQDAAQRRLQRAFRAGRLPHAYLFSGPVGVGKEMLAARLAAVLVCEKTREVPAPDGVSDESPTWREACGRCVDCELMAADTHPDFHRVTRSLAKLHPDKKVRDRKAVDLSIDVIRHFVIEKMGLRPGRGRAKVFVIVDAERMSMAAQNAMLKTLEEPPEHSYLVLLTTSADLLLPTTRSRCHQVAFYALPPEFVAEYLLQHHDLSPQAARFLAVIAQGSLGVAQRFAETGLYEQVPAVLSAAREAAGNPLGAAGALLEIARQLTPFYEEREKQEEEEGPDTNAARAAQGAVLTVLAGILRDLHRLAVGLEALALPPDSLPDRACRPLKPSALRRAIQAVPAAEYQIRRGANTALTFDALTIELGRAFAQRPQARH
jgi:DNA polymerase-3 subunit delta'